MSTATLYASSPTLDGIRAAIVKFYCGSTVTLAETAPGVWSVSTGRGLCDGMRVILKRGRYRFESA